MNYRSSDCIQAVGGCGCGYPKDIPLLGSRCASGPPTVGQFGFVNPALAAKMMEDARRKAAEGAAKYAGAAPAGTSAATSAALAALGFGSGGGGRYTPGQVTPTPQLTQPTLAAQTGVSPAVMLEMQNILRNLALPSGQGQPVRLYTDTGERGSMLSFGPGLVHRTAPASGPRGAFLWKWSSMAIPPGTQAVLYSTVNWGGRRVVLPSGSHNLHMLGMYDKAGPKSLAVMPEGISTEAVAGAIPRILALATPALGCAINMSNYQTHPLVVALKNYINTVKVYFPLSERQQLDNQLLRFQQEVTNAVISNQAACGKAPAVQQVQQVQQVAPPTLPAGVKFWFGIQGKAAGPFDMPNIRNQVAAGTVTRDTYAWKQGMATWKRAIEVPELKPLFGAAAPPLPSACATGQYFHGVCLSPALVQCQGAGGHISAKVNTRTGRIRRDTIRCYLPGSGRETIRHEASGYPLAVAGLKVGTVGFETKPYPLFSTRPLQVIQAEHGMGTPSAASMAAPMAEAPPICPPCDCPPPLWPAVAKDVDPDQALTELRDNLGQLRKRGRTFQRGFRKFFKDELGDPFTKEMTGAVSTFVKSAGDVRKLARDYLSGDWTPPEAASQLLKALGVSGRTVYGPNNMVALAN